MEPDKDRKKAKREEFAPTYTTAKSGRRPSGKTPRRLVVSSESAITAASHGDQPAPETYAQPPREDRAG